MFESFALITVLPDHVSQAILSSVSGVIALGADPRSLVAQFNSGSGQNLSIAQVPETPTRPGQVLAWLFTDSQEPVTVTIEPPKTELRWHRRKYAAGELGEDKSFYFRGPEKKLNLRAHNMNMFAQLAEGVDEDTWAHHLRNSDYSRWLRDSVKDNAIAEEVATIEKDRALKPAESRTQIIDAIRKHYTAPA